MTPNRGRNEQYGQCNVSESALDGPNARQKDLLAS